MRIPAALIGVAIALLSASAYAQVHVRGYTRSGGVYVRPHIRSAPDSSLANNYGASRSSPLYSPSLPDLSVVTPSTRDHDRDGVANMYDGDDDNDGVADNHDPTQYGAVAHAGAQYLSTDQILAQYDRETRNMLIDFYNQSLRAARADGRITPDERSYLDFIRQLYSLQR